MNSSSIDGLLMQFRSGDHFRECWEQLHVRFWPFVIRRAMDCGLTRNDAEDVASQLMMRLPGQLQAEKYDASKGRFEAWLNAVIRNAVKDYQKSRCNRDRRYSLDDSAYDKVVDRLAAPETAITLASELCQLYDSYLRSSALDARTLVDEWEWRAFFRTAVRRLPAKEVAGQLDKTPGEIYRAKYKVKNLLERALAPEAGKDLKDSPSVTEGPARTDKSENPHE